MGRAAVRTRPKNWGYVSAVRFIMRPDISAHIGTTIAGALLTALGIALHYLERASAFGGLIAILGAGLVLAGVSKTIPILWRHFRHPNLPRDVVDRLTVLGEDPERYQRTMYSEGLQFVCGLIEDLEDAASRFREWMPRLRDFATECRRKNPIPSIDSLSARDRAKLPVYASMIRDTEQLPRRRKNEVAIFCLPEIAIPVAQQLWPGRDECAVFLTPDELSQWDDIYKHPEESFWWFIHYWWNIQDPPGLDKPGFREEALTLSDGGDPWLIISGLRWGILAGGETSDLWSFDGQKATFVRNVGCIEF